MNKLESCWPANGTVLLLLLQWLQDAPAYRDMQGGGAGLSAPACLLCPADDSSPRRGPLQLGGLLDLDWSECMLCTVCRVWPSGLSDCLISQRRHPLIRPSQAPSPETSRLSARLMFDQPTEPHVSVISISLTATAQIVTLPVVYLPRVLLNSRRAGTGRGCSRDPPPPLPTHPCPLAPLHRLASPPAVPARESHLRRWMQGWHWPPSLIVRITRFRVTFTCLAHPPQCSARLFLKYWAPGAGSWHLSFFRCFCAIGLIPD